MITVKNTGPIEFDASGRNQNPTKTFGEMGTVRVSYENREYVFGPNDSRSLEDGIAKALVAQDSRLTEVNTMFGSRIGNSSLTLRT